MKIITSWNSFFKIDNVTILLCHSFLVKYWYCSTSLHVLIVENCCVCCTPCNIIKLSTQEGCIKQCRMIDGRDTSKGIYCDYKKYILHMYACTQYVTTICNIIIFKYIFWEKISHIFSFLMWDESEILQIHK